MNRFNMKNFALRRKQKGAVTMFSAILILILLTELVIYAVQVGVFEQRKSANEVRQKLAFHIADSAVQQAKQFLTANAVLASSDIIDQLPDGSDGWLAAGSELWKSCAGYNAASGSHPCYGEPVAALRAGSYFFEMNGSNEIPINAGASPAGANETVAAHALLCMLEIDRTKDPVVQGCTTDPAKQDFRYFMVTLLGRGQADCEISNGNPVNCKAEALVADKIGSFGPGGGDGGPGAPLTARTNVPLSGTVEIVPNPNGGGVGVPISSWVNNNPVGHACPKEGEPISPNSGSYATCERQEWYGQDTYPADFKCPTTNCACKKGEDKLITYAQGNERVLGIDIVPDDDFPCDLFTYTFGIDKSNYEDVRALVPPSNRLEDCSSLDQNSFGFYWISGPSCTMKDQIGSVNAPVFLVISTADLKVNAGAEIFGTIFFTNVEYPNAEFSGNGHATIYGSAIMDATMEHFNGTFQIVYLENVIGRAFDTGGFGAVAGGWTDFHTTWQ